MMQPAIQHMSEAEQRSAALARRARLRGPDRRTNITMARRPMKLAIATTEPPLWQRERIRFDLHVLTFKAQTSPIDYMKLVAVQTGVRYFDNIHERHNKENTKIKNETCYDLKIKFGLGVQQIGNLMRTDHSTICRRINVHCAENRLPMISEALSKERCEVARELYASGLNITQIAKRMKASVNTVRNLAKSAGWYVDPKELAYGQFIANVDRKNFEAMILVGFSMRQIQRRISGSPTSILRLCDEMGLVFSEKTLL